MHIQPASIGTLLHTRERQEKRKTGKGQEKNITKSPRTILWEAVYPEIHKNLVDGSGYELSVIRDHLNNIKEPNSLGFDNRTVKRFLVNSFVDDVEFSTAANSKKSQMVFQVGAETSPEKLVAKIRSISDPNGSCTKELNA